MLIALKQVLASSIDGVDGNVGSAKDLYFDGESWEVRYLVVDTGTWLPGKRVLLTPVDIEKTEWGKKRCFVRQTKEQVKNAPHIDSDKPVSRQMERELAAYYGWPSYWHGGAVMGAPAAGVAVGPRGSSEEAAQQGDPQLRSAKEVRGYHIAAIDGDMGHVADFIIDDERWTVRYLVVETGSWLTGRQVLLSPAWVDQINWQERSVTATMSREAVKESPEFHPHAPVNREYEEQLYDYYGEKKYW